MALPTLDVAPWGLASGKGAWNATITTLLFAVAGVAAWKTLSMARVKERDTSVHTCGIPEEDLNLHTTGQDLYSAPRDVLMDFAHGARTALKRAAARLKRKS